ncbi:MAG: extensin family protein [Intrasporangium sp.]|uniref:extensin family protein n=1 Tax=Intrasporangium sp. TaxID=1925024 RepID=UPI00264A007C|nr:extensin family protein [Intrasporangium sp.]MDN5795089.1 extensin family protein [Intrasporangium sp.]
MSEGPDAGGAAAAHGPARVSRRRFVAGALGLAAAAGGSVAFASGGWDGLPEIPGLTGIGGPLPQERRVDPVPVPRADLQARARVGSAAYVYELSGKRATYYVTEAFGRRLDAWLALHAEHVGQAPEQVWSYGAWAPAAATSWHASGEAFDLSRLRAGGADLISLRYDAWRDAPAAELRRRLRLYWRTAAALHLEFADVLTYLYNSAHANHIHVDIGRFGPERPRLIRRSRAQVQAVQAMCRYVWGRTDVPLSGRFDEPTRDATTAVLASVGDPGELADSREAWQAFLVATMQRA